MVATVTIHLIRVICSPRRGPHTHKNVSIQNSITQNGAIHQPKGPGAEIERRCMRASVKYHQSDRFARVCGFLYMKAAGVQTSFGANSNENVTTSQSGMNRTQRIQQNIF